MLTLSNKKDVKAKPRVAARRSPARGHAIAGGPLELDIDLIDEDPNQPRTEDNPGFLPVSLAELAATVHLRGVKTPISVRDNPGAPGRYIINHGARRFRASKLAGKSTIPGFVDNDYSDADQVIENLQRNELTPREIADYVGRELAKGNKKGDVARSIGKSAAFVTQHVTLLDLPSPVALAFNSGRARDVTVINELVTCYKKWPGDVAAWLDDETQDITRSAVKLLREYLDEKLQREESNGQEAENVWTEADDNAVSPDTAEPKAAGALDRLRSPIVHVRHNKRAALLQLHRKPSIVGYAWLTYEDDGTELEIDLSQVRLIALMER